ncbi:MAG: hypothetical protein IKL01_03660, partial [Mailhella sp.]|nr:hypothetical protein [Mailhella sp.]
QDFYSSIPKSFTHTCPRALKKKAAPAQAGAAERQTRSFGGDGVWGRGKEDFFKSFSLSTLLSNEVYNH